MVSESTSNNANGTKDKIHSIDTFYCMKNTVWYYDTVRKDVARALSLFDALAQEYEEN